MIKFRVFKALRTRSRRPAASRDAALPAGGRAAAETAVRRRIPGSGSVPNALPSTPFAKKSAAHGAVRQRNPAGQPRSRNAAFVPRLRDERDRGPGAAGRPRRPEAGPPARAVRDARGQHRLEPAVREVRAGRRRRDGQVPPARRHARSTTRWSGWRRTSRCATR